MALLLKIACLWEREWCGHLSETTHKKEILSLRLCSSLFIASRPLLSLCLRLHSLTPPHIPLFPHPATVPFRRCRCSSAAQPLASPFYSCSPCSLSQWQRWESTVVMLTRSDARTGSGSTCMEAAQWHSHMTYCHRGPNRGSELSPIRRHDLLRVKGNGALHQPASCSRGHRPHTVCKCGRSQTPV